MKAQRILPEINSINDSGSTSLSYTPGPHYVVDYGGFYSLQKEPIYSKNDDLLDSSKCRQAWVNANLYAAAPILLETLQEIYKVLNQEEVSVEDVDRMIAQSSSAIKKAIEYHL